MENEKATYSYTHKKAHQWRCNELQSAIESGDAIKLAKAVILFDSLPKEIKGDRRSRLIEMREKVAETFKSRWPAAFWTRQSDWRMLVAKDIDAFPEKYNGLFTKKPSI